MIVQDKQENMQYFGAIQFDTKKAKESLALYPNVQMKVHESCVGDGCLHPYPWMSVEGTLRCYRPSEDPEQDFIFIFGGHIVLKDGDWLVTDKDGETYIYSDEAFKREFTGEVGDLS